MTNWGQDPNQGHLALGSELLDMLLRLPRAGRQAPWVAWPVWLRIGKGTEALSRVILVVPTGEHSGI